MSSVVPTIGSSGNGVGGLPPFGRLTLLYGNPKLISGSPQPELSMEGSAYATEVSGRVLDDYKSRTGNAMD
ncbi:MAG: hypothetical protein R3C01_05945 [Planctomycetaceae bacterium]